MKPQRNFSSSLRDREVAVTVYTITGRQLFLNVGQSVCEECELTVAAVARAIRELDGVRVNFKVKAWLNNLPVALLRGAYHPPVLLVDGKVVSQGVVPTVVQVKQAIIRAMGRKPPASKQSNSVTVNSREESSTGTLAGQSSGLEGETW